MATGMSKGRTPKATTKKPTKETTKETVKEVVEEKPEKRVFKNTDSISCKSITNGELLVIGKKTGSLYKWAGYGDIEDVEYQDLVYELKSGGDRSIVMAPYFIVLDDDFVKQNPKLDAFYSTIYSVSDLEAILKLPVNEIKKVVPELPYGVKESLKGLVSTKIDNKQLTDLNVIKALDEVFNTNFLLIITQ